MAEETESKITYLEGNNIRVIRARVDGEEKGFLILQRLDCVIKINKNNIIKIEGGGTT